METTTEFPQEGPAYLNNASASRMPLSAIEYMAGFVTEYNSAGPDSRRSADMVRDVARRVRRTISGILRCQPDEVALTQSVTDGINAVAGGLVTAAGANMVMRDVTFEHHANVLPWLDMGIRCRMLKTDTNGLFDMDSLREAVDDDTALVALSHAAYNTGAILPLEPVGRMLPSTARFFVDAAQTVGCLDYDFSRLGCDFAAFNGSKWLCGPMGTGLFYCRRDVASTLHPLTVGGESAILYDGDGVEFKDMPDRFEGGFRNYAGVAGLAASLDVISGVGLYNIRRQNVAHTAALREGLADIPGVILYGNEVSDRISVVSFNVEGMEPAGVVERLEQRGVIMALREIGPLKVVRASPHFYNTTNDIEKALSAVSRIRDG